MNQPLTEDDEGKRIVAADGETIGTVAKVDQGVAHVDPEEDYEAIQHYLDWEGASEEDYTFQETAVAESSAEELVLKDGDDR